MYREFFLQPTPIIVKTSFYLLWSWPYIILQVLRSTGGDYTIVALCRMYILYASLLLLQNAMPCTLTNKMDNFRSVTYTREEWLPVKNVTAAIIYHHSIAGKDEGTPRASYEPLPRTNILRDWILNDVCKLEMDWLPINPTRIFSSDLDTFGFSIRHFRKRQPIPESSRLTVICSTLK